jgi:carboxypeptidase Taq
MGDFGKVKAWLVKNVHSIGNLYSPTDLIRKITGKNITVDPYLSYLNKKYSELYGF